MTYAGYTPWVTGEIVYAANENANFTKVKDAFDDIALGSVNLTGAEVEGDINMGGSRLSNMGTPLISSTLTTKNYFESKVNRLVMVGMLIPYLGVSAPSEEWLVCNGSEFSIGTYPALYTYLGSNILPDLRARRLIGKSSTHTIRTTGGAENVNITHSIMAAHSHTARIDAHNHTVSVSSHNHTISGSHNHKDSVGSNYNPTQYPALYPYGYTGLNNQSGEYAMQVTGRWRSLTSVEYTGVTLSSNTTGVTLANAEYTIPTVVVGNSAVFDVLNPYKVLNFLIKAK